jgi:predicted transcriptional regulator
MTGIGKVLVFLNLMAAAALLTWGLSAFKNSPQWVDSKTADGQNVEGEISMLKKEIDRYAKAASGAQDGYTAKAAALQGSEATRDFRKTRLDTWLKDAEKGAFFALPVVANDPAVLDTSDAAERGRKDIKRAILGPDNTPLKGLDALQKLYQNELDDRGLLIRGKVPAAPAEWMNPAALLAPARMADLGIDDLRRLHGWLSDQQKVADVAIDKQRVIQANLADEASYLGDKRIDWTAQLQTLEQRNKQLKDRLQSLEK